MPFQPAVFQNETGGRRELTKIFTEEPRRLVREEPVDCLSAGRFLCRPQQLGLDASPGIHAKQIVFQAEEKIFRLPFGQGGTDSHTGKWRPLSECSAQPGKSLMQPPLQLSPPFP